MAEDLYSAILNSAARNAARQEMDTTVLDRLAMEQQLARLLAGQRRRERQAEIWPGGTFTLVEPEKRPSNALYEVLSNARLNRGLENLAGNAAEVIFGEPTGNAVIDYGVSNIPGVGAVAIGAGGGQPGLIDILGGIGAPLKGMAVIAKPLASRIIRNASYTTGQDLGMDAARNVARNVIDRMARIQGDVTGDEIYPFIKEEMQNLGLVGARDEARIRELATGFAEDTYLRALEDLEAGKTPRLNLVLPEKENIAYKPLYEGIEGADDGLRMGEPVSIAEIERARAKAESQHWRDRAKEGFESFTEEEKEEVMRRARERAAQAIAEGKYASEEPSHVMYFMKQLETGRLLSEKKAAAKAALGPREFTHESFTLPEHQQRPVSEVGKEAYRKAVEEALASGLSGAQATRLGQAARNRATRQMIKELGGSAEQKAKDAAKSQTGNARLAFTRLHPDIQKEITDEGNRLREEARAKALAEGATGTTAKIKGRYAFTTYQLKRTREILKELGFKNANDPRLQNYEVIGRTPEESVMKAVADDIFGE